jgi:hypothetical protein
MNIEINKHVDEFLKEIDNIDYGENGMFNSEIYMVYLLYRELNCNLFIESGIDYGVSTQKFLKLIHDEYIGIDINEYCLGRMFVNNNFKFICGNSLNIINNIVDNRENNIFIMIDGPKGYDAIKMKNELLENKKVKIVAIHDTYDGLEEENHLRVFETKNNKLYYEKYFNILNQKDKSNITTIYNKRNNQSSQMYIDTFPSGPGVSIYSKIDLNFIL